MDNETREFYTNAVQITTGLYDVTFYFRVQTPVSIEEGREPVVESKEVCSLRMSPQHAKSVAALLVKQIIEYESANSLELPLPPNIKKLWDKYCRGQKGSNK